MFIDSDCEAHRSWAETILNAYQRDEFDACGGPDNAKSVTKTCLEKILLLSSFIFRRARSKIFFVTLLALSGRF